MNTQLIPKNSRVRTLLAPASLIIHKRCSRRREEADSAPVRRGPPPRVGSCNSSVPRSGLDAWVLSACLLLVLSIAPSAWAQSQCTVTNPIKFQMPPNLDVGWDVLASHGVALADDFHCNSTAPITDTHTWGA